MSVWSEEWERERVNIVLSTRFNLDVQRGTLPSFSKSVISLTKHYDKERRRIRSRRKRTSIAAFARTKRERKGVERSGVGASSLSFVVFCVLLRANKQHLITERKSLQTRRSWWRWSKFSIRTRKATNAFESCSKILNRVYGRYERTKGTTILIIITTTETRTWWSRVRDDSSRFFLFFFRFFGWTLRVSSKRVPIFERKKDASKDI